ncbi:hypothetical protein [Roseivivax sp. CAU 1761]
MVRQRLDRALEAISAAALDPRGWNRVQSATEILLGAISSQLAQVDHRAGNSFTSRTSVIPEIDTELCDWGPVSEPVIWAAANPHWRRFVDYDYIDEAGMRRSAFYTQNAQYDITYRLGCRLLDTPGKSSALVWMWPRADGHVQAPTLRLLEAIRGPLRLAALVSEKVSEATAAEENVLATIRAPAFLTRPDGRLLASNDLGARLLLDRSALILEDGMLRPCWRPGRATFRRILAETQREPDPQHPKFGHVILPRQGLPAPAAFAALPLSRHHHFILGARATVLLVVTNDGAAPGTRFLRQHLIG